ncbi:hypothetical protein F2P81_024020 [Scophthalmus maximus]|uniref:Uncharacterized protein n=1 Tax=Scophthalmus maximus TaxID=52904 RepID=A0A6A4RVJ8_SCOMX|nr:hypothetical protein F2P81_024020 [Scophthalmus maximus]
MRTEEENIGGLVESGSSVLISQSDTKRGSFSTGFPSGLFIHSVFGEDFTLSFCYQDSMLQYVTQKTECPCGRALVTSIITFKQRHDGDKA